MSSYDCAFRHTLLTLLLVGALPEIALAQSLQLGDIGGGRVSKVYLSSTSNQPYQVVYGGETMISEKACLLSLLNNKDIARELELVQRQEKLIKRQLGSLKKLNAELMTRIDTLSRENKPELIRWIREKGRSFDEEFDGTFLPHQIKVLRGIRLNYLACVYGYAKVFDELNNHALFSISTETLKSIERHEKSLRKNLQRRCNEFCDNHIKKCLDELNQNQRDLVAKLFKDLNIVFPELLVGHAELLTKSLKDIPSGRYEIWGTQASWLLHFDGRFKLKLNHFSGYEIDYLMSSLKHEKRLSTQLQIVEYQKNDLAAAYKEMREFNARIQTLLVERKSTVAETKNKKKRMVQLLDDILLPLQKTWLDEQSYLIAVRRTGVFWQITKGDLSRKLKLSSAQIQAIKRVAAETIEDYEAFSKSSTNWYQSELTENIANSEDQTTIKEFFEHKAKRVNTSIGVLAFASEAFRSR